MARAGARILCDAGCVVVLPFSLGHFHRAHWQANARCRGNGAPQGASIVLCAAPRFRDAGASRRSTAAFSFGAGPRFRLGYWRAFRTCVRKAGLADHRQRAPRRRLIVATGRSPGAARVRGSRYPRPQAPHQPAWRFAPFRPTQVAPSSRRLATTPSAEQGNAEYNGGYPGLDKGYEAWQYPSNREGEARWPSVRSRFTR